MKQWAVSHDENWAMVSGRVSKVLEPDLYEFRTIMVKMGEISVFLRPLKLAADTLINVPDSVSEHIVRCIEEFWTSKNKYDRMGVIHKRGFLLEGAPGTGKTAVCLLVGRAIAKRGGVALFTPPTAEIRYLAETLKDIREMQPNLPVLNIMEDIDKHKSAIDKILPMLDGETQIDNVVHLATTNFIENLDSRLFNRPSRFDEVIKMQAPSGVAREAYLRSIMPKDAEDSLIQELVKESFGLYFAHIKELAICSAVYGRDIKETSKRLRALAEIKSAGFKSEEKEKEKSLGLQFIPFSKLLRLPGEEDEGEEEPSG